MIRGGLRKEAVWYILDMLFEEDPEAVASYLSRQVRDFKDRRGLAEWVASLPPSTCLHPSQPVHGGRAEGAIRRRGGGGG